ncbi:MAG: glycosyltransferase family 1 protein [Anaerolineales bacterium]|nr:glycosyltransferase family 1 protein [Anaerolineales bacterium]
MKVLHLPYTVGGNPQGISKHLNLLGVNSQTWTLYQNYLSFAADKVIFSSKDRVIIREIKRLWALRYIFIFDTVFFNFGTSLYEPFVIPNEQSLSRLFLFGLKMHQAYVSFMQKIELTLLTLLNRKVFIQYQGDDARQGDYCLSHFEISPAQKVEAGYYTAEKDALKRKQIETLTHLARKTYALNPDLLHVLPKGSEFLPYSHISLEDWAPNYTQLEMRPLRFGHAPTHRGVKGTDLILEAVENLHNAGYDFEFVLIEGLSNQEAKKKYASIDVLIDQLYAGWYGGLAVEVMALGKPVLVYIREDDLGFIPEQMRKDMPFIQAKPNTIQDAMKQVLEMPRAELVTLARQSRAYVERWHDPVEIAKRIKSDLDAAANEARK